MMVMMMTTMLLEEDEDDEGDDFDDDDDEEDGEDWVLEAAGKIEDSEYVFLVQVVVAVEAMKVLKTWEEKMCLEETVEECASPSLEETGDEFARPDD